jgi:hypothetical protein
MPETLESESSEYSRLIAQRNAALLAVLFLVGVVVCAGWALEVFPRRNAEVYRLEDASLRSDLNSNQQALLGTQEALGRTEGALRETQTALANAQDALKRSQRSSH